MKTNFLKPITLAFLASIGLLSCSDDDPTPVNEEEVITSVTLAVTPQGGGMTETYVYNVNGEFNPKIALDKSTIYNVSITFENASDPEDIKDVTTEVIEEADDHYVFYQASVAVGDEELIITNADDDITDNNDISIGINTVWNAVQTTTDLKVLIYLIHQPTNKTATEVTDFDGTTDVEATFNIDIN